MAEEEYESSFKDISDLRKELQGIKGKKDISANTLQESVQKLTQVMDDMLEIFSAAAEQMKLEDREFDSEVKKHDVMIAKLDKVIEQNKTIAESMVVIVDMVKQKVINAQRDDSTFRPRKEEQTFRPKPSPNPFMSQMPQMPEPMQPMPSMQRPQQMMPSMPPQMQQPIMPPPPMPSPSPDFAQSSMQPDEPSPDLDLPEDLLEPNDEPKKKGLFARFKR